MFEILKNPTFARLFAAQVVALAGTGLLTVALGLLAYDLAGDEAGSVLGTAYAIKMIAYVGLSPIAAAIVMRLPRRAVLIWADLVRGGVAVSLPFIDTPAGIYLAIFILQTASATFTPTFQATIPDVLTEERDYTRGLSLSRLAYDLENLLSPALAALLLMVIGYHWLFAGTVTGFLASAFLVSRCTLPHRTKGEDRPFLDRLTRGTRIYLATPRLRGLLALTLGTAAAGAFVIVETVVVVRSGYGMGEAAVGLAMAAFGAGSMVMALTLPRILDRVNDRPVMLAGGAALAAVTLLHGLWIAVQGLPAWGMFLALWCLSGLCYSSILTPTGRLLRRSSQAEDRPALFAAQFALSHACWLITYPLAGILSTGYGFAAALIVLGLLAVSGVVLAVLFWRPEDEGSLAHSHPDLARDDPHLKAHRENGRHSHAVVIDDLHHHWPRAGA